jgi:hypothetical protein
MRPRCGLMRGYMSELLQELEDDLRQERFDQLWQKFGKMMVVASLAIILGTALGVVWKNHRQTQAAEQTAQMLKASDLLNAKDFKGASAAFDQLMADKHSSYYGIATLRKAQAQTASGDKDGATKTYSEAAGNDGEFGALAALMAQDNAKPIVPDKNSPFYFTELEWHGWQLLGAGKKDEAANIFLSLRDDKTAPRPLRSRMQEALQHIAPEKAMMDEQKK